MRLYYQGREMPRNILAAFTKALKAEFEMWNLRVGVKFMERTSQTSSPSFFFHQLFERDMFLPVKKKCL